MTRKDHGLHMQVGAPSFEAKDYGRLTELEGFSPELIEQHVGLYQGYVRNANRVHELLRQGDLDEVTRSEVRRRFGWEFNGMRLHELYFDVLAPGGSRLDPDSALGKELEAEFGSLDLWAQDFRTVGSMRGIGWAALVRDDATGRYFNTWIDEHDAGHLAGTTPLLVMDVFEHAFMRDFGTDRRAYMDAFFRNIDWNVVQARI